MLGRYEPFLFPKDATLRTRMDPAWGDATGKVWSAPDTVAVEGKEEPEAEKKATARSR